MSRAELDISTADAAPVAESEGVVYTFAFGNKSLRVTADFATCEASSHIENIPGVSPLVGATTAVYAAARDALQRLATRIGNEICYQFTTENDAMRYWATDPNKGRRVFHWDFVDGRSEEVFCAQKNFYP